MPYNATSKPQEDVSLLASAERPLEDAVSTTSPTASYGSTTRRGRLLLDNICTLTCADRTHSVCTLSQFDTRGVEDNCDENVRSERRDHHRPGHRDETRAKQRANVSRTKRVPGTYRAFRREKYNERNFAPMTCQPYSRSATLRAPASNDVRRPASVRAIMTRSANNSAESAMRMFSPSR